MAAKAIVAVVIQELTNLLTEESQIFGKASVEVHNVMLRLGEIEKNLNHPVHQEQVNMELMNWIVKFMGKLYRVEDVIVSFAAENRLKRLGFVKKPDLEFKLCRQVPDVIDYSGEARRFKKEMEGFLKEITECKNEIASLAVESRSEGQGQGQGQRCQPRQGNDTNYGPKIKETIYKKDVKTMVDQLSNHTGPLQIISIFGKAGIGKADHVKAIHNTTLHAHKSKFSKKNALAFLKPNHSFKDLIKAILQRLFISTQTSFKGVEKLDDEGLITKLQWFLEGEKYLICISDIRSLDHLNKLRSALPDSENGSTLLISTPVEECALFKDASIRYHFKPVDMEDGVMIFKKKVWGQRNSPFPVKFMDELKKKIEEICGGKALTIAMLAGLLSARNETKDEWRGVFKELDAATKSPSFHIFTFCYDDLPLHLKPCFLYLGLFEKDFEIPVRRLLGLWLAEGFVKPEGGTVPEDMVESYFEELVRRNMVEITKRRSDESPRKCRMVHALHDIFSPMAVKIGLFHLHKKLEENSKAPAAAAAPQSAVHRRVVEYTNINTYTTTNVNQNLRSYISFNGRKKDMPADEVGTFIDKIIGTRGFGLLKVLDLEGVYRPRLKENLGKLLHLTYLGLRWTFLDTLPPSVGALVRLETLDIKHTHITTLPPFIWTMRYLRHLYLNGACLDIPVPSGKHKDPNQLHTIQGLFVDERLARKIGSTLKRFTNIRKLDLTRQSTITTTTSTTTTTTTTTTHSESYEEIGLWIKSLASLQSLRLRSRDKLGRPSELKIKSFSSLKILSRLYLLGHLREPLAWYEFPPGLTILTLSVSQLDQDPMATLSQLKKLRVLRLLAASYLGEKMDCPRKGFPSLQVLKLWKLENLKTLTVQAGTMQNLHTLDIRCCRKLEKLPVTLLEIKRFDQLILTDMPESFVSAIRENKKNEHTYTIVEEEKDI